MRYLRDISKRIDIHAIADKYELPHDAVRETVERSISDTLSVIFRADVECLLTEEGTEIYIFRDNEVERLPVEKLKKNILRAIKYGLVSAFYREQAARRYENLRLMAGGIAGGYITKVSEDGIYVEIDSETGSPITGVCDRQYQTPKERGLYRIGDYYNFYVSGVTPFMKGGVPEVKVSLCRTSKSLTEGLLKKELAERLLDIRVRCVRRAAGAYSLIEAEERIPKECIKAVSGELKERVIVRVIQKK